MTARRLVRPTTAIRIEPRRAGLRPSRRTARIAAALITLAATAVPAAAQADDVICGVLNGVQSPHAIGFAQMRTGPGPRHPRMELVRMGTQVLVLQSRRHWLRVQAPSGSVGWIFSRFVCQIR